MQDDQEDILKDAKMKEQSQNIEIMTLKKACEMQKEDIEELTLENRKNMEYNKELVQKHQEDMLRIEEEFNDERTTLREKLHEVWIIIVLKKQIKEDPLFKIVNEDNTFIFFPNLGNSQRNQPIE